MNCKTCKWLYVRATHETGTAKLSMECSLADISAENVTKLQQIMKDKPEACEYQRGDGWIKQMQAAVQNF